MKELTTMQPNELKKLINETFTGKQKQKQAAQYLNVSERTIHRYTTQKKPPDELAQKLVVKHAEESLKNDQNTIHTINIAKQFSRENKTKRKQIIIKNAAYIISHGELIAIAAINKNGELTQTKLQP